MAKVVLENVKKVYPFASKDEEKKRKKKTNLEVTEEGVVAVQEFSLDIEDREFIVLVGPSGCGKSTTLRMIAGLEEISEGNIYIGDELVNNKAPKDRDIAMVFQNYALYPHMTVFENMAFSLKLRKVDKAEIERRVNEAAEILDITDLLQRKPKALSGGQRQRVAIGRAFVRDPKVFLMDEPLSNLDAKLRNQMRAEIIKLRDKIDTTFIYVTHDQIEAMTLGDRIVIMKDGFIQQIGTPQEVFAHPKNLFVAGFIGMPQMNFFRNAVLLKDEIGYSVDVFGKKIPLTEDQSARLESAGAQAGPVIAGVRPVDITVEPAGEETKDTDAEGIRAVIDVSEMMGSEMHIHMAADGTDIIAVVSTGRLDIDKMSAHSEVEFSFDSRQMHLFDPETEENLIF